MHGLDHRFGDLALAHVGLVCGDNDEKPQCLEIGNASRGIIIVQKIFKPFRRKRASVTEFGNCDHTVPVKEYGA